MTRSERPHDVRAPIPARVAPDGIGLMNDDYVPPEVVVHDGDEFVRALGPAQACSPSPSP